MPILRNLLGLIPALLLLMISTVVSAQDFVPVPSLQAHVTDMANMLDSKQRATLDNVLKDVEARTGNQIAVLLVSTTAPEAIEQYGIRVADAWKLGRKGVDDGVILIVAKDNPKALRRLRIEAGRGVQGTLTDAQSKRILQDVIAPHFRQNDFYGGLTAGVSAIATLLDQEHLPAPAPQKNTTNSDIGFSDVLIPLLFILSGVIMMLSRNRRTLGRNDWGQAAGIILGSALSHGSWRGGSSNSGGFSGGGGGFDGGGASGDW